MRPLSATVFGPADVTLRESVPFGVPTVHGRPLLGAFAPVTHFLPLSRPETMRVTAIRTVAGAESVKRSLEPTGGDTALAAVAMTAVTGVVALPMVNRFDESETFVSNGGPTIGGLGWRRRRTRARRPI